MNIFLSNFFVDFKNNPLWTLISIGLYFRDGVIGLGKFFGQNFNALGNFVCFIVCIFVSGIILSILTLVIIFILKIVYLLRAFKK